MATPFPRPAHVRALAATDLARRLDGVVLRTVSGAPCADPAILGVTLDSRSVRDGDLYAALPGANVHGARFLAQALDSGAVAVLTDEAGAAVVGEELGPAAADLPLLVAADARAALGRAAAEVYARPDGTQIAVYGITGTNGKTTTAYLVDGGLRSLGLRTGLVGTVETRVGDERLRSTRTTPEASDLQALLAVMAERGVQRCTMEVSSHALVMHRVDGVVYDVAAFTNLSQDHLDFHGTMEDYFAAKALLFTPQRARRGVVVVDDPWGRRLAEQATIPVVTVSATGAEADWQVRDLGGRAFVLTDGDETSLELVCPLPGDFNQVNTAVAALLLHLGGEELARAARAVCEDPHVPGRMERVETGLPDQPLAVVDFAHTPEAVGAALRALRPQTRGRLVVVLGAGGDRDPGKRPHMGAAAAATADLVVVTDDNPRSEDPADIRAAVAGGVPEDLQVRVQIVPGRAAAIRAAAAAAPGAEDTVVVLGKGHEQGQEIAGQTHPFDDREELAAALREHRAGTDLKERAPHVQDEMSTTEETSS